jgi:hypothetical protein
MADKTPFDEIARRAADSLEKLLRSELVEMDACTAAAQAETPLIYDDLLEIEQLKPTVYYYAHENIPKHNEDGEKFIAKVRLGEDDVYFFHSDWLSLIKSQLGEDAWLLVEFDMERYALEWMDEELQQPRPPELPTKGFMTYVGRLGVNWRWHDG